MWIEAKYEVHTTSGASELTQLTGWSAEETSGSAGATIYLRDTNSSGSKVVRIKLAAGETAGESYVHPPSRTPTGARISKFYVEISGSVNMTLYGV